MHSLKEEKTFNVTLETFESLASHWRNPSCALKWECLFVCIASLVKGLVEHLRERIGTLSVRRQEGGGAARYRAAPD